MNDCPHVRSCMVLQIEKNIKVYAEYLLKDTKNEILLTKLQSFDDLTTFPIDHIKLLHQFSFISKWRVLKNYRQFR